MTLVARGDTQSFNNHLMASCSSDDCSAELSLLSPNRDGLVPIKVYFYLACNSNFPFLVEADSLFSFIFKNNRVRSSFPEDVDRRNHGHLSTIGFFYFPRSPSALNVQCDADTSVCHYNKVPEVVTLRPRIF